MGMETPNLFDSSKKMPDSLNSTASHQDGERRRRSAKALTRLEACLQAKLSEVERAAYMEFLCSMEEPNLLEPTIQKIIRDFRPERTRLPMPSEFIAFMDQVRDERDRMRGQSVWAAQYRQWQDDLDREDREDPGGREAAKAKVKKLLCKLAGRPDPAKERKRAAGIARQRIEDGI